MTIHKSQQVRIIRIKFEFHLSSRVIDSYGCEKDCPEISDYNHSHPCEPLRDDCGKGNVVFIAAPLICHLIERDSYEWITFTAKKRPPLMFRCILFSRREYGDVEMFCNAPF